MMRENAKLVVLRDPLKLCEDVAIDHEFAPVLDLLDGHHSVAQIRQSLLMRGQIDVSLGDLDAFVDQLDLSGWLDGERFIALWTGHQDRFMEAETIPPRFAGTLYPSARVDIESIFDRIMPMRPQTRRLRKDRSRATTLGLVTPYQALSDTSEGSLMRDLLSDTLRDLPNPESIETVVLLGTDLRIGLLPYAITDRPYATALGVLPIAGRLVADLDTRLDWVLQEEIRHDSCPSLELASLLLRGAYGDACPPVLHVLCGQTSLTHVDGRDRADLFAATLETLLESRGRCLLWASAEMSHVGPAYNRDEDPAAPVTQDSLLSLRRDMESHDKTLLAPLQRGHTDSFTRLCMDRSPSQRPSGTAAIATLARLLPVGYRMQRCAYSSAPAPGGAAGFVGLAGLRFFSS